MIAQILLVFASPLLVMQSSGDCETDRDSESVAPDAKEDVEVVLDEWQMREPKIKRALVRFQRYEYDDVFAAEKRGVGELHFEPRIKYRWTIEPADVEDGTVSARETPFGERFQVTAETAMTIFVDQRHVIESDSESMTYYISELPPNSELWRWELLSTSDESEMGFWERLFVLLWHPSWIDLQASLLTGTNIEQLRETFDWSMSTTSRDGYVRLTAQAANSRQRAQFSQIDVLLDPDSYRTKGVRIMQLAATRWTVIVPINIEINGIVEAVKPPSLNGYKLVEDTIQPALQAKNDAEVENPQGLLTVLAGAMFLCMLIL